jgi:hypothetical protein
MSRYVSAAGIVAVLVGVTATAGVEDGQSPAAAQSTRAASTTGRDASVVAVTRNDRAKQSIRCWQEGKLVYEASGVASVGRVSAAIELKASQGRDVVLQVIDLRQGFCVIERPQAQ